MRHEANALSADQRENNYNEQDANKRRMDMITQNANQLMAPDRLSQIPDDVNLNVSEPKGYQGLCIGRDKELEQIHGYFATQYRNEAAGLLGEDDCIACILTNAPGAGKTTLREAFIQQLREKGIEGLELSAGSLMHPDAFVDALVLHAAPKGTKANRDVAPEVQERRKGLHKLWFAIKQAKSSYIPPAVSMLIDLFQPGLGTAGGAVAGTALELRDQYTKRLVNEINMTGDLTPLQALAALAETYDGQYILTVDEGHTWADPDLDRKMLHEVLSIICNPSVRKDGEIRGGGLLISGLGNVKDNLDGLGLSRAEVIWMRSLNQQEAETIIRHDLKGIPKTMLGGAKRKRILADWPPRLAESFHPWPQHAGVCGRVAKAMVLARPTAGAKDEPEQLEWVKTKAAERIVTLYAKQLGMAVTGADPDAPGILAAMRLQCPGMLPHKAVYTAVEDCRRRRGLDFEPRAVKRTMGLLKQHGIIRDEQQRPEAGGIIEGYETGIPSMADHTAHVMQLERPEAWDKAVELAQIYLEVARTGDMRLLEQVNATTANGPK